MGTANLYGQLQPTSMMEEPYQYKYGLNQPASMGIDEALKDIPKESSDSTQVVNKEMARAANSGMSAGGSAGQVLTGAGASGLMTGAMSAGGLTAAGAATGGGALAAGLALSYMESERQADAAHERAVIEEAQNRKSAVQTAINGQLSAARMLSIT